MDERLIQSLIDVYIKAQENLVKVIAEKEAKGSIATYQKSLLIQVMKILQNLDDEAKKWSEDSISNYYQQGINDAVQGLKSLGQDVGLNPMVSSIHQGAIDAIVSSCYGDLHDANNFVGRRIQDVIRQAGIDAVANKLATGQTVQECKKNIINSLVNEGINGIKDKRGRNISLDAYASTVARSTTREATNTATQNQLTELGYDLVKMSSHATTCPICSIYQGRVYSISGKTPGYPPLSIAFSGGYANIHPNCRHVIFPYIRALDDNADKLQEDSNRPFEVAEKDKASIDAYNKQQSEKRQLRVDRSQYQEFKLRLGDDVPKNFGAFRQMKNSNSEKWQELLACNKYLKSNPDSDKIYYNINKRIEQLRIEGSVKIKGIAVKPTLSDIKELNSHTLQRMEERNITKEDAQSFIDNSVVAFKQRKGTQLAYYSEKGFTAVSTDGVVLSTGWLDEAGKLIVKEVNKIDKG
jgi:hypothetical protein